MPEPITRSFDTNDPEQLRELVERLVTSKIKSDQAIDKARKGMFGNGLMKSLSINESSSQDRVEKVFEFFRAWASGSEVQIDKLSQRYATESKSLLDSGRLTPWEYKTLAPANEGTNSAGGYSVPIEFAADLSRNLGTYGYARRHLRTVQMSRQKWELAGLLTKPTVALVAEGAAIGASKPVLDQLILTAKKVAGLYPATNELLEDANIDTYSIMVDIFTEQFQIFEDQSAFQNATTNWPGMLYYGAGAITAGFAANGARAVSRANLSTGGLTKYPQFTETAGSADSFNDMLVMMSTTPSALFSGGKFFIDQNTLMAILSLRDTAGGRMMSDLVNSWKIDTGLDGQPILRFAGYEMVVLPTGIMYTWDTSAHASAPFMCLCNPMKCYAMMGLRGGFFVEPFDQGTVDSVSAVENDLKLLRMKERIAFGVGRPETMVILRTDAS